MKANKLVKLTLLISLSTLGSAALADANVKVSTGYLYVNGQNTTTGLKNTKLSSIPVSVKLKNEAFGVKLSTSYLSLNAGTGKTEKGMGDTNLTISYDITPKFTLSVKEKFSTGNEKKGLSTGFNDTKVQADYSTSIGNGKSVFASVGYKVKGGKSSKPTYRNAADASIGMSKILANNWVAGGSLNYAQASTTTLDNTFGVLGFASHKLNKNWRTNLYAGYDNSKTSTAGLSISYKF